MKWKLYYAANFINMASTIGFITYVLIAGVWMKNTPPVDVFAITFLLSGICITKATIAFTYLRKLSSSYYNYPHTVILYYFLVVLQLGCAAIISYAVYDMVKMLRKLRPDLPFYFLLILLSAFVITALFTIVLDYSLTRRLKKFSDPTIGLLEYDDIIHN